MLALPPTVAKQFHEPIRLADWVEFNLLAEEETVISVDDMTAEIAHAPPDAAGDSEQRERFWDDAERTAEDALAELARRAAWLGACYPLVVGGDTASLRTDGSRIEVFRFLCLLRARQIYDGSLGDDATESGLIFEDLVTHALGAYLGSKPQHRVRFGVAGGTRGGGLPLPLDEAVIELSKRMNEEPGTAPNSSARDYRGDAIAWKPFGDQRGGQLVLVGQATISEGEWTRRQPPARWTEREPRADRLVNFVARPTTAVAFVETLSLTPQDVVTGLPANFSSVPLDRLRLLRVLCNQDLPDELGERMDRWVKEVRARLPR